MKNEQETFFFWLRVIVIYRRLIEKMISMEAFVNSLIINRRKKEHFYNWVLESAV